MLESNEQVYGIFTLWTQNHQGIWIPRAKKKNKLMVTWGLAAARALGLGDNTYRINRFYVEFENVSDPEDAVTVPSFTARETRSYYEGLATPRDYLRIPVTGTPELSIAPGYEDYFAEGEGNMLSFYGLTSGTSGMNGVTFSDGSNSKVYGIALVAAPDDSDRTKDVVISRLYYEDADDQPLKPASGQIMVSTDFVFKPLE